MNTITKYFLTCTFLCGMFLTNAGAQKASYDKANALFQSKKFFKASIEYERVIFREPSLELLNVARYKKALCYRHLHRYEDALDELNRIALFNAADTMETMVFYEKAFNLLLSDNYTEAFLNIQRINEKQIGSRTRQNIQPLKILILNHNREWDKAKATFLEWADTTTGSGKLENQWKDSIECLYSKDRLPKNYSEETARNWSRFIPGAGHVYSNHPWEGAASFLLNAAALGFGLHQIWYKYYFTGYVAGLGIFYKTYFGGMERAGNLANIERKNEMTQFNNSCTRLIKKILKTNKGNP